MSDTFTVGTVRASRIDPTAGPVAVWPIIFERVSAAQSVDFGITFDTVDAAKACADDLNATLTKHIPAAKPPPAAAPKKS